MILNTFAPTTNAHPRMVRLQRQYRKLAMQTSDEDAGFVPATVTYIPSSGTGVAFDRPIARVGSVQLCRYGQHMEATIRSQDTRCFFQGLRASYLPDTGQILWERDDWFNFPVAADSFGTAFDERLLRSPRLLDVLIGLAELSSRSAGREAMWQGAFDTPRTLLGFAPDVGLASNLSMCPTAYVKQYAETNGLSTVQAWRAIEAETYLPGSFEMTGLQLIDARLCADPDIGTKHLPRVLGVFHDLRPVLGRHFSNPTRRFVDFQRRNPAADVIAEMCEAYGLDTDPGSWTQQQADEAMDRVRERLGAFHTFFDDDDITEALVNPGESARVQELNRTSVLDTHGEVEVARGIRRLMAEHISEGATDDDLVNAFMNAQRPLVASKIAKRQTW